MLQILFCQLVGHSYVGNCLNFDVILALSYNTTLIESDLSKQCICVCKRVEMAK